MKKVIVTGSNGFLEELYVRPSEIGLTITKAARDKALRTKVQDCIIVESLDANTDWIKALNDCDAVPHLSDRINILKNNAVDSLPAFQLTNTQGTF